MNNLLRLIGNRLLWLPIMVFGVTVLVFFLMSLSPIDPAFSALGENASPDQLEAYRVEHGLNDLLARAYLYNEHEAVKTLLRRGGLTQISR